MFMAVLILETPNSFVEGCGAETLTSDPGFVRALAARGALPKRLSRKGDLNQSQACGRHQHWLPLHYAAHTIGVSVIAAGLVLDCNVNFVDNADAAWRRRGLDGSTCAGGV